MTQDRILVPEKLYAGTRPGRLGHITAWGTDSGAKGRIQTLNGYVGGEENARIMDNVPLYGFEIVSAGSRDEWVVQDPRGLKVSVKSDVISRLLRSCTIVNGAIQHACVWARSNGQNVLLNTETDTYTEAVRATQVSNLRANWKNAKIGDTVTMQTGVQGIYLGRYNKFRKTYCRYSDGNTVTDNVLKQDAPVYVILKDMNMANGNKTRCLMLIQTPRLAQIDAGAAIDPKEAEQQVNSYLTDPNVLVDETSYGGGHVLMMSADNVSRDKMALELSSFSTDPVAIQQTIQQWHLNRYSQEYLARFTCIQ